MESKACSKCNTTHPLESYYKSARAKDGRHSWCRRCVADGMRELARKRKAEVVKQMGGKCNHCGGVFHPAAYDLHHIDPTEKEGGIAQLLQSLSVNNPKIQKEIAKCILLCANCHRVEHSV